MKKRYQVIVINMIMMMVLFCPIVSMAEEMLDIWESPASIFRSGSFESTCKTRMDFSFEGGTLTGASWTSGRHAAIYSLEGTFKEGEEISIGIKGIEAPGISEQSHVFNCLEVKLVFLDKGYNRIGKSIIYSSDCVKDEVLSYAGGNPVPKGTIQVSASGYYKCRWSTPNIVVEEKVGVLITLKPEKTPPAAMVTPTATPKPKPTPEPEEPEEKDLEPVVQVEDDPVSETEGEESTPIKTAAIIGIAATVAALGAAGAAGAAGGSAGAESAAAQKALEEAARQKTGDYRMVVYKTFGDTIEFNKTGQEVYARIESVDPATGMWQYDAQKSMTGIVVSLAGTEGLTLGQPNVIPGKGRGISFVYKNPNPIPDAKATLSFRYTAPDGGYFERQMAFKLAGKPEIIIEKNTNLLSTEAHFDLPYRLVGCGESPQIAFSCPSGLVTADLSVGDEEKKRFLRISPAEEAIEWDQTSFIKQAKCKIEVRFGNKPEEMISEDLEIGLCYEGLGTAYEGIQVNKIPKGEDIINCDPDKDKRFDKGVWLPVLVMKWDEKSRILKHNTALSEALEFEFELDKVTVDYSEPERLSQAQSSFGEANPRRERTTRARPAEYSAVVDSKNNPMTYVLYADNNVAGGADPLPVSVTIVSSDPAMKTLELSLKIQFSNNLREYLKRYFAYSENTFARSFASFGDVNRYLSAMDFIEDRVFKVSNAPFDIRMDGNYYEHAEGAEGYGDWLANPLGGGRVRSVVLKDACYPQHGNDMNNIKSLVHELSHAIEHMNGSLEEKGAERHAYFLEYASEVFNKLAEIERGVHTDLSTALGDIVNKIYRTYVNEHNTDEPRMLSWFGANMPLTQHYFIDKYIQDYPSSCGSQLSQDSRLQIADILASVYFPLNIMGYYREETGPFKGTVWSLAWNDGLLGKVITNDTDKHYIRVMGSPKWVGGNKAVLRLQVEVSLKGKVDFEALKGPSQEIFDIEITSASNETYDMNNPKYEKRDDLVIRWYPRGGVENSMIYKQITGNFYVSPLTPCSRPSTFDVEKDFLGKR